MPSGTYPTYSYRPPGWSNTQSANVRVCSSRRARLLAGGTYFRSVLFGKDQNNITIGAVEVTPGSEAYAVITNQNPLISENVIGNCGTKILNLAGATYEDLWIIDQLDSTPRARYYSISLRIAFQMFSGQPYTLPTPTELGSFKFGQLFSSGKLSVLLTNTTTPFGPSDTILIKPRVHLYSLSGVTVTPEPDPVTGVQGPSETGYDLDSLRSAMESDTYVTMPVRGTDVQDTGMDDLVLSPFAITSLTGGDGLPPGPSAEVCGPTRSLILLNYAEKQDGSLSVVNTMYEWNGSTTMLGAWRQY